MKKKTKLLSLISTTLAGLALSLGVVGVISHKEKPAEVTFATYTNGDAATYYNSIDSTKSGNDLLEDLRTLNLSKRQSTVGYSSMGTSPSGQFKYTDYDTSSVQYDSNGQPYGTRISSFYTYSSATSWNREHVWPNSHGGGSGGDAGSPYPDADIHMPRPTISSENSSRGNSFFVEGMNHSSSGWDPYTAGYNANSRGEAARITFYCTLVNSKLILAPNNTTPSGKDSVTGQSYGSGHTMGNLETLIKWNINYPVTQREKNRNEGAEYLQGNRNAFVDHPEYACKIWGNVNSTIKNMCDNASWDTGPSVYISKSQASIVVDGTTTISAAASDSSNITWTTSDATIVELSSSSSTSGTNITLTGVGPGTATVTAKATINSTVYTATCAVTVSSSGGGEGGGDTPVSTDSYTLTNTDMPSSYPKTATQYTADSGLKFYGYQVMNQNSKIQLKNGEGYIYNSDSLNLGTLTISGLSGNVTVYAGDSRNPSSNAITGTNGVYNLSGYNYFKISCNSGSVATCTSITVGIAEEEEKTLSSISVATAPTKTTYTAGETFNPAGLVITRTYSDSTSDTYAYAGHTTEFTFSPSTSTALTTSNASVTITYGGKSTSQAITVSAAKTLSSISVSSAPTKTSYIAGEMFDPTGLVITRTYSDSSHDTYTYANHSSEFTFTPSTSTALETANVSVTISYGGKSTSQAITVAAPAKTLSSITLSGQKTSFELDEAFSFGGTVTAHFSDSTTDNVTTSVTFSGNETNTAGTKTVTVSYTYGGTTKTATYQITVTASGGSGEVEQDFSGTYNYSNKGSTWSLTDCEDKNSYWLCPASGDTSVALVEGVFSGKTITSSVVITINCGTFGQGSNPSESTFEIYNSSACTSKVTATQSGTLPTSKNYTEAVYTVSLANSSGFSDDFAIKITKPGKQIRLVSFSIEFSYTTSGPTLSSISLNTENVQKAFNVGAEFNYNGLVVTANYSDSTSAPISSGYTVSTPDMSTAGNKNVTVSYGGKSATYQITVSSQPVSSISASVSKTYLVGETISSSDITVIDNNGEEIEGFNFANDGYQFTYADAASGGALTGKTFNNSVSFSSFTCSLTVQVKREARDNNLSSTDSVTYTDLPTTYQTSTTTRTAASGIKFIAYNLANYSSKMQFKASGGYFQTVESLKLTSLTIHDRESNTLTVQGSTNGSSFTNVSGTNDVYNLTGYYYVKVIRNSSNAAYCSSISISYTIDDTATNVANYIMYEDTNNQCTSKLSVALGYYNGLSSTEKTSFQTSTDYVISTARARLEAWAKSQGKTINYSTGELTNNASVFGILGDDNSSATLILVVSLVSTASLTVLLMIKKKRMH